MSGPFRCNALVSLALVGLLVIGCGTGVSQLPTSTTRPNQRLSSLISAAREEGSLDLSWAPGFLDSPKELARYTDEFTRLYGLTLRVGFTPQPDIATRLIEATTAGRAAPTDVFLGTEAQVNFLAKATALIGEPWTSWAPNVSTLKLVAPGGVAVEVQSRTPGITYNSQKLTGADIPRSMADLLKARYRGHVATTSGAATFDRLGSPDIWGPDRALEYVKKLGTQLGGFMECGDESRIVGGDFDVFAFDCGSARVAQLKANGELVGWSVPADAAFLRYLYMGVPKTAAHPNAARLWINFMVGREAQNIMYTYEYADHYLIPGSRSFGEVDRATKAGVRFYELTVEAVQAEEARGFKSQTEKIQSIFRDSLPASKR
jgi:ABC-type Fe3+ transport system substrate-binding protein